jgi:hypothetical protein
LLENQYRQIGEWIGPIGTGLLDALALWYLYRIVTFRPQ